MPQQGVGLVLVLGGKKKNAAPGIYIYKKWYPDEGLMTRFNAPLYTLASYFFYFSLADAGQIVACGRRLRDALIVV